MIAWKCMFFLFVSLSFYSLFATRSCRRGINSSITRGKKKNCFPTHSFPKAIMARKCGAFTLRRILLTAWEWTTMWVWDYAVCQPLNRYLGIEMLWPYCHFMWMNIFLSARKTFIITSHWLSFSSSLELELNLSRVLCASKIHLSVR